MSTLLNSIESIPNYLKKLVDENQQNFQEFETYINKQKITRIAFIASGSSYNAVFVLKGFSERCLGISCDYYYPNMFVNYSGQLDPNCLYVVISQGGSTKLVFEALNKIKENNLKNVALTSSFTSIISKTSDCPIEIGCGNEPYMYRTIGYSTSVVTSLLLMLKLAKSNNSIDQQKLDYYLSDLVKGINNLDKIVESTNNWYNENKFGLMKRSKVMLAGTNDLYAVAQEADIKIMEMVPMVTRSFELEEFIHGPQNAFDDDTIFFVLSRSSEDQEKAIAIAKFLKNEIGYCSIIGDYQIDQKDLNINPASKYFSFIEYITVFQTVGYHHATNHGRDLKRSVNSSINQYITKTL